MIDLENQKVGPNPDELEPIKIINQAWMTPYGLINDLGKAVVFMKEKGETNLHETMRPVTILTNTQGYREVLV
jgi:hypothetical protein